MLCYYAMACNGMLCWCYAMLCCAMLFYARLCCATLMLWRAICVSSWVCILSIYVYPSIHLSFHLSTALHDVVFESGISWISSQQLASGLHGSGQVRNPGNPGNPAKSKKIQENPRKSKKTKWILQFPGFRAWFEIQENPKNPRIPLVFLDFPGFSWIFLDFPGFPVFPGFGFGR